MNRVIVNVQENDSSYILSPKQIKALDGFVRKTLAELGRDKRDISVLLCGDKTITSLNSRYRGKNEATDILSFAQDSGGFPNSTGKSRLNRDSRISGDIAVSLDTLRENARRFKISDDEELRRLLIHGILHLDGMDHKTNKNTEPMLRLQEEIMSALEGYKILPVTGLSPGGES